MTDLERFVELYRSFGIECVVNQDEDAAYIALNTSSSAESRTVSSKIIGTPNQETALIFDESGRFIHQVIYP